MSFIFDQLFGKKKPSQFCAFQKKATEVLSLNRRESSDTQETKKAQFAKFTNLSVSTSSIFNAPMKQGSIIENLYGMLRRTCHK